MILTDDVRKLNMIEKNAVITLAVEIGLHALLLYYELKKDNANNNIPTSNFIEYIRKLETIYQ